MKTRLNLSYLDPVHAGPDPYGHHINLKSLKTSTALKFVIKAYHRKSGKSKYDGKLTELDVETTRIRSRVNGVLTNRLRARDHRDYKRIEAASRWGANTSPGCRARM